jgi:hypothetical protein
MLGTYLALKRAKAILDTSQIRSICKVWEIATSVSLVDNGVVEVAFKQEGTSVAFLRSEPGLLPWLIVQIPTQWGQRTVLATGSLREAAGALCTLLEVAKK